MDVVPANTQFARDVSTLLTDTNGKWQDVATHVSHHMNSAEELLQLAFSMEEPNDKKLASINKTLKSYGMSAMEPGKDGKFNRELFQFTAQEFYRKVQRSWETLLELVQNAHRMTMEQIRKVTG